MRTRVHLSTRAEPPFLCSKSSTRDYLPFDTFLHFFFLPVCPFFVRFLFYFLPSFLSVLSTNRGLLCPFLLSFVPYIKGMIFKPSLFPPPCPLSPFPLGIAVLKSWDFNGAPHKVRTLISRSLLLQRIEVAY